MIDFIFSISLTLISLIISGIVLGFGIFSIIKNKNSKREITHFLESHKNYNPSKLFNLQMSYVQTSSYRTIISIFNECDIYVFANYITLLRRQKFVFKFVFKPIYIYFNKTQSSEFNKNIDFIYPDKFAFNKFKSNLFEIKFTPKQHKNFNVEIKLKHLTTNEINLLKAIEQKEVF